MSYVLEEKGFILKIRHLNYNDELKKKYLKDLLVMSNEDKMNRFGYISEESIINYVNTATGYLFYITRSDNYYEKFDETAAYLHFSYLEESEAAEIGFHVAEKYKRKGLAQELINEAYALARQMGLSKIYTYCARENVKVQNLLKKQGFEINLTNEEAYIKVQ